MVENRGEHAPYGGGLVVALAAVVAPMIAVPLVAPDVRQAVEIAGVSGVVTYIAVLFADVLIYLHWRMTGGAGAWLVMALTLLATQSLALAGFIAADAPSSETHPTRILLVQGVVALGLLGIVAAAQRYRLRIDPLLAGAVAGAAVVLLRYLLVAHTDPIHISATSLRLLVGVVLVIDLLIAVGLFRLTIATPWVRNRLGCAMAFLSIAHAAAYPTPANTVLSIVTVSMNVLGASVVLWLAIVLVQVSWSDNRAALELLGRRLETVEAEARIGQARLHELRATVGGLAAASRLVHHDSAVSEQHRRRIERMMDDELERLERLLSDRTFGPATPVDLDATIEPIVVRHRTRGYPIAWDPAGLRAIARPDDVAEVVSVLLENAAQHAPGAGASIRTRRTGDVVEIAISDNGPGVSRGLRPKIFEWGQRGLASGGSGIGLNVARQLSTELGGYLRLVESSTPGATFVLGLPAEETS